MPIGQGARNTIILGGLGRPQLFDTNVKATSIDEDIFTDQEVITAAQDADLILVLDVSETPDQIKYITRENLFGSALVAISGNVDNRIPTATGTALQGEANLLFDGTILTNDGGEVNIDISSGDPHLSFQIGGTDEFTIGVDDSDSDILKIDTGGTVGGATKLSIDTSGNVIISGGLTMGSTSFVNSSGVIQVAAQTNITSLGTLTGLTLDGNKNISAGDGSMIHVDTSTLTDNGTSSSGTAALFSSVRFEGPTLAASNSSVTTTDAATVYIANAPSAGTNQTISNAYALVVDAGNTRLDGDLVVGGDLTISGDDLTMGTNTSGAVLVADGTNYNPVVISGDITIATNGAATIADTAVEGDMLNDNIISGQSEISSVADDDVLLAIDTSGGGLKKIARSTLVSGLATSSAISNVADDSTPQLGGDLDVNSNDIVSTSNGNITITPNGSGVLRVDGSNGIDMQSGAISIKNAGAESYVRFYCEVSNAHYTQLQASPHSAYSGNVTVVLPAAATNLVGDDTTQTLTNKTLTSPVINTGTFGTSILPVSADGTTLGSATKEFSDLFLADGGQILFGDDQEITLTHVADDGLVLKHVGTADGKEPSFSFHAGDNDIAANDVLGSIFFKAPDEGAGTDAILTAAGIEAVSEGDFAADNNATKLSFLTGASEAAAEKMSLSSGGNLTIAGDLTISGDDLFMNTNTDGMVLVADGTNFNPVQVSGDVELSNSGATTIQAGAVEHGMLADDIISGQNEITSGFAAADELMYSDAGTIKRVGLDTLATKLFSVASAGTVAQASDHMVFLDGGATGDVIIESIDDFLTQIAGANVSVSSSQLTVASSSATALDDIATGDGASNLVTTSGNITLDAQANDADVIIKVDDNGSSVTAVTFDGSDEGNAIFVNDIQLKSDSSVIKFGADLDVSITHDPDDGLFLKSAATADNNPFVLTLQTGETDIAANDVIGALNFQAPDEGTGTDAILVAAGIEAISEGDFAADNNATKLSFKTGASEAASEKMSLSSVGLLTIADDFMIKDGGTIGVASANDAMTISSAGIVTFKDDILIKDGGTIGVASAATAITIASSGIVTFVDDIIIKDAGTIGSASDTDAISISSGGVVNISATPANTGTGDGALTVAGGMGVAADVSIGDDLRLISDSAILSFGANSEVTMTHVHNVGLTVTNTIADTDNRPVVLQLKSEEDAIVADDVIGSIEIAAGDSDGTDGATIAAGIHAIAENTFSASANPTKLVFTAGVSETAASSATAKMTLSSAGLLTIADDFMIKDGGTIGVASTNDAITISSAGIVTFKDDIKIKDGGTIGVASAADAMTISSAGIVTFKDDIIIKDGGTIGSASDTDAISISSGGVVAISATTANSDASDGALTVAGGASVAADLTVGDDLRLLSDASVLSFGADGDSTITHADDAGLTFNSTSTFDEVVVAADKDITMGASGRLVFGTDVPNSDHEATGVIVKITSSGTLARGVPVYIDGSGTVDAADADAVGTMPAIGINTTDLSGGAGEAEILISGIYRDDTYNFTVGNDVYVSTDPASSTANSDVLGITTTAPSGSGDTVQKIGVVLTADTVFFNFNTAEVLLA